MDDIEIANVGNFEKKLLEHVREKNNDLLNLIKEKGSIDKEMENTLDGILKEVTKHFIKD